MSYRVNTIFTSGEVAKGDRFFQTLEEAVEMAKTLQEVYERNNFDCNVIFEEVDNTN